MDHRQAFAFLQLFIALVLPARHYVARTPLKIIDLPRSN
jgi:hypothetical protein